MALHRSRFLPAAAALAVVLGTAAVHSRMPATTRADRGAPFVPRPGLARALSLGFDAVLADYYWLQAVQIVGSTRSDPSQHATQLGRLIDVVTSLDPWVDHPYRFAAIWMTDTETSVRHANRLLEKGIAHHPEEWRNYFYLGFNLFYYLQDKARAAEVLFEATQRPGSPRYLPRLVARLRSDSGDLEAAAVFLNELIGRSPDAAARAEYQGALDEIEVERKARFLDAARRAYRERTGADIRVVEDLSSGPRPLLRGLPDPEPSSLPPSLRRGSRWILDEDSGKIVSTFYGHRYEMLLSPFDRKRLEEWRGRDSDPPEVARDAV